MSTADGGPMTLPPWKDPEMRARSIGSSDAAAVCGVDPYRTPLEVYLEKRGEVARQPAGEAAEWGDLLQPVLLRQLARREALHVVGRNAEGEPVLWDDAGRERIATHAERGPLATLVHAVVPYMTCHLDGFVPGSGFAEAKTAGFFADGWGEGDDEIPAPYLVQIHHAAAVLRSLGMPYFCRVPVLRAGQRWHVYEIEPVRDLMDAVIERTMDMRKRIVDGRPPDPTARDLGVLARLYPHHADTEIDATPEVADALAELLAARNAQQEAGEREAAAGARIRAFMGEASCLNLYGRKAVTWRTSKDSCDVDWRGALATLCESLEVPEDEQAKVIEQHTTTRAGGRRFTPAWKRLADTMEG